MSKISRQYDEEFKKNAVKLVVVQKRVQTAAKRLTIPRRITKPETFTCPSATLKRLRCKPLSVILTCAVGRITDRVFGGLITYTLGRRIANSQGPRDFHIAILRGSTLAQGFLPVRFFYTYLPCITIRASRFNLIAVWMEIGL